MSIFRRNLAIGLGYGVFLASGCTLLAITASLLQGSLVLTLRSGRTIGLLEAIAAYWAGALLCGAAVGLLLPLARWRAGAALGGALAAVPIYAATHVAQEGLVRPSGFDLFTIGAAAAVVGGLAGLALREHYRPELKREERRRRKRERSRAA